MIAGALYERIHTRDLSLMGGFWSGTPFMGFITLVFVMASLGLPGLVNFVAEFLILNGAWQTSHVLAVIGAIGLVLAMAYSLRIMRKIFFGPVADIGVGMRDLTLCEKVVLVPMTLLVIFLGLFPQHVFNASEKSVKDILAMVNSNNKP